MTASTLVLISICLGLLIAMSQVYRAVVGRLPSKDKYAERLNNIEVDLQQLAEIQVPRPTPKPSSKSPAEVPSIALSVKQRDNLNCPLCLDRVDTDVIMCVKCNTLLHYDCVEEMNKGCCPVLGCKTYLGSEKTRLQIVKRKA